MDRLVAVAIRELQSQRYFPHKVNLSTFSNRPFNMYSGDYLGRHSKLSRFQRQFFLSKFGHRVSRWESMMVRDMKLNAKHQIIRTAGALL